MLERLAANAETFSTSVGSPDRPEPPAAETLDHVAPFQEARPNGRLEFVTVNEPATCTALVLVPMASMVPVAPPPNSDHVMPFHRARLLALLPPAISKRPPTSKSPALAARVATGMSPKKRVNPPPRADQTDPSHLATCAAFALPANVNAPPT